MGFFMKGATMDNDVATFTKMRAVMERAYYLGFEVIEEPAAEAWLSPMVSLQYKGAEVARFGYHSALSTFLDGVEAAREAAVQRFD